MVYGGRTLDPGKVDFIRLYYVSSLAFYADKYHIHDVLALCLIINSRAVAEQFAGQHLLYSGESYADPELYCWNREQRSSSSEVDYLLAHGAQLVPVEIKAGKVRSLQSLHVFAAEKGIIPLSDSNETNAGVICQNDKARRGSGAGTSTEK